MELDLGNLPHSIIRQYFIKHSISSTRIIHMINRHFPTADMNNVNYFPTADVNNENYFPTKSSYTPSVGILNMKVRHGNLNYEIQVYLRY
jgi:hypothetical protein